MNSIRRIAAVGALLAVWASTAAAQNNQNDSVDYIPATKTVAGQLPVGQSYSLEISAPTQLNKEGDKAIVNGVVATLRVNVASYPDGSSAAEASTLVSLDAASMTFFALGESHTTVVTVNASAATTPGDYVFDIQADGPNGIGWGNAAHRLNVLVAAPTISDTTAPAVTITSPADGYRFTFCSAGTLIPVTISANDAESVVTAVWGAGNGVPLAMAPFAPSHAVVVDGGVLASDIGGYELTASATSAGGTGHAQPVAVSVGYAMSWLPPLSLGKEVRGSVAIKFAAKDCEGKFVSDERVSVEVWERLSSGDVKRFTTVFGEGSDSVRIEDGLQYIANFAPAAGVHHYTVRVLFNGLQQTSIDFSSK